MGEKKRKYVRVKTGVKGVLFNFLEQKNDLRVMCGNFLEIK